MVSSSTIMFTDQDWIDNFRMSARLSHTCVGSSLPSCGDNILLCDGHYLWIRVAITLWCLAKPTEYRTIAHLFGLTRSTVCEVVHETQL